MNGTLAMTYPNPKHQRVRAGHPSRQDPAYVPRKQQIRAKPLAQQSDPDHSAPATTHETLQLLAHEIDSRNKVYFNVNWPRIKANVLANVHRSHSDWRPWQASLRDRLAILVGSGPSLNNPDTLRLLKEVADKNEYMIFAANRAFPILEKHGIMPDFVVAVDRISPPTKRLTKTPVKLIACYEVNKDYVQKWIGPRYMVLGGSLSGEDATTNAKLDIIAPHMERRSRMAGKKIDIIQMASGGNVGTFMLIVARAWFHAKALLMLGHDYGNTVNDDPLFSPVHFFPGRWSKGDYLSYAKWTEYQMITLYESGATDYIINSSLDGILNIEDYVPNMFNLPFKEVYPYLMQNGDAVHEYLREWVEKNPVKPLTMSDA